MVRKGGKVGKSMMLDNHGNGNTDGNDEATCQRFRIIGAASEEIQKNARRIWPTKVRIVTRKDDILDTNIH